MMRWSKAGVLDRVFEQLQRQRLMQVRIEAICLDSSIVQVHPDGTGAQKKTDLRQWDAAEAGRAPKFIWLPRMIATS